MYKIAFIDMDGTLLRKDHTVSDVTKKIITELTAKGVLIIPISARPLHGMLPIIKDFIPKTTPIVSLNGSYIFNEGKIIYKACIGGNETNEVYRLCKTQPVTGMYYYEMEWYAETMNAAVAKEQKITPVSVAIGELEFRLNESIKNGMGANKILIAGDVAKILEVEQMLNDKFNQSLNIYKSQPKYVEVMHKDASKVNAMKMILEMYGINKDEAIAIGDNYNDVSMIEFAGKGIAMGNAPDDIKAKAGYVTDTNNNDGVAKALKLFF